MIKLIIFDLSNVCYNLEELPYMEQFAKKHNLNYEELDSYYQEFLVKAEVDEMTGKEVWERVLKHFNIEGEDIDQIIREMIELKEELPETLALVKKLREEYKVAFFTNYNKDYWEVIQKKFDVESYFDFGLVSYQAKSRKPAAEGFKIILSHFNLQPEEAVFTDDSEGRLVQAKELGISTIHFQTLEQFTEELKQLGVEND